MKVITLFAPNKLDKRGEGPVVVCVRISNYFTKHINTGIRIKPSEWDAKKHLIKGGVDGVWEKNNTIKALINSIEAWEIKTSSAGFRITGENFTRWFNGEDEKKENAPPQITFNAFYKNTLDNDNTLTHSSQIDQTQTLNLLNEFRDVVEFVDLNSEFVDNFDNWLIKKGYAQNTRKKHHKNIKKYLNKAIRYKHLIITLDQHPYNGITYPTKPTTREFLTKDEILKIENLETTGRLTEVKDMFLFSCYTGLRFSDVLEITPANFDGNLLRYVPQKTEKHTGQVVVPLDKFFDGKGLKIAQKYSYQFPAITNQEINRYLKDLMIDAEISKLLTFHVSRHTFLTHVAFDTGNIFQVMKLGGLRKTDTAMIYVHLAENL